MANSLTKKLLSSAAVLLAFASTAQARPVAQLSELLRSQLQHVPQSVDACTLTEGADGEGWDVTAFFIDVSPYVAVGIADVLQIQVTPEFEFIWTRED